MANNLQHAPHSLLDDQRSFSSMGSGDRMSIYDYFTLREEQPPLDVDPSAPFHDRDPDIINLSRCESSLFVSEAGDRESENLHDYLDKALSPTCTPPISQNIQLKVETQDNNTTMIEDEIERTARAVEATPALRGLGHGEIQEILKDKEEFSFLAKRKIAGAAKYNKTLKSALLKVEAMSAEYQSLRATTQESQKAIVDLTRRLDLSQETIHRLIRRLDRMEAENYHLRARVDTQKDINNDIKAAIRNFARMNGSVCWRGLKCLFGRHGKAQRSNNGDIKTVLSKILRG